MVNPKIIGELPKVLRPVLDAQDVKAAVALLLKLGEEGDLEVFLVKRAENPLDAWSGQMALPGGKRSVGDGDLRATVVRETFEETGVALADARFLGSMPVVCSLIKPSMRVLPFVFLLEHEPAVRLRREELEACLWVSIEKLRRSRGVAEFSFGVVPAFVLGENVVWGLTYNILNGFLAVLDRLQSQQV